MLLSHVALALVSSEAHFAAPSLICFTSESVVSIVAAAFARCSWTFFFARFQREKQLLYAVSCATLQSAAFFIFLSSQSSSFVSSRRQK
jgi:uncharacterized membrane protein